MLRRNNTNFPTLLTTKLHKLFESYGRAREAESPDSEQQWAHILKYYQYLVRAYMSDPEYGMGADGNARGLLIYHTMGMGKTRLAVAVALALWDIRAPVLLLAKSLQRNFKKTIESVIEILFSDLQDSELSLKKKNVISRFAFISMDAYNSADQMSRIGVPKKKQQNAVGLAGLDGKLLVVDEAHNFFRAIINSSSENANARQIYEMIQNAKNLRILFLTGTPASKDPFELVPCFNMLAGASLLPTQYEMFYDLFVDQINHKVKNPEKLSNRLLGLVSHASHSRRTTPFKSVDQQEGVRNAREDGWFPEEKDMIIEKIEMSIPQYRRYLLAREKEDLESKNADMRPARLLPQPLTLPGSERKVMKSYYVRSRTLSNASLPKGYSSIKSIPDDFFTVESSPKMALIAQRTYEARGPVLIYSQFVDLGGLKVLGRFLRRKGFEPYIVDSGKAKDPRALEPKPRFAVISGEVSPEAREAIQLVFNTSQNMHGEIIKAILVSKTGAEGLDLKWIRETHQLEPYWDRARDDQVKSRAVRLGSHDGLPRAEREVQPYLYISVASARVLESMPEESREKQTIDELFYQRASEKYKINQSFRDLLAEVSLECDLFGYGSCRTCMPTNAPLFHGDPITDVKAPDPCEAWKEESIQATEIVLDGISYYYSGDPQNPDSVDFYIFRDELGGYVRLENNLLLNSLLEKITKPSQ